MMHKTLFSSWPLFFGLAMIMIGNGLQGTLLGVRANIEGFETITTGLIMSVYYGGFLLGSIYVPKLVSSVGHIRVFAALASLGSTTILIHGVYSDPFLWALIRIFTGFSYAGLYIVIESWLNNMTTNKIRGQILGLYMFVSYGGMVLGQFLLNLASPEEIELFVLTSILVSLALLPIALSSRPAPELHEPEPVSLRRLYIMSPLGMFGAFCSGLGAGCMFGLGAVFAAESGFSLVQISTFMAAFIIGGVLFQIPIGWLSDRIDRRRVLIGIALSSAFGGVLCALTADNPGPLLYLSALLFGGLSLSIYGLCLAHTNDHLNERQVVAAGSSLILVNSMGACFGPFLVSGLMTFFGTQVFFPVQCAVFIAMFLFGLYRTQMRAPVPLEEQGDYVAVPARTSPIVVQIAEESAAVMKDMSEKENTN